MAHSCRNSKSITENNMKHQAHTNRLIKETSPYLLQHAHNPVDWYPWGKEALEKAKKENKLLVISIGYAACHWCHVMEHESFEDTAVANLMNRYFVSIKVDREERPDIDQIYMHAVQMMTGRGGWPLNVIALPDGRPVWGGTYFPKEKWMQALRQLAEMWGKNPEKLKSFAEKLEKGMKDASILPPNPHEEKFTFEHLKSYTENIKKQLDYREGGRLGAPKFPMPGLQMYLYRYAVQAPDMNLKHQVEMTLTKMARGGIYDHIGGGFARYSTDFFWHIPHFEKMLYDNAQLVSLYSKVYQHTHMPLYKEIVYETLQFIERELTSPEGVFYSSLDADSKNREGKLEEGAYYVWTPEELKQILGPDFELFKDFYNINEKGHWEGNKYHLIRTESYADFAAKHHLTEAFFRKKVKKWKEKLRQARNQREKPRLDDKILTSWNALMITAYADAYSVFHEKEFLQKANKAAGFILENIMDKNGHLFHSYKNGQAKVNGLLEDYALLGQAFIRLYEAGFDEKYLHKAKLLTGYALQHFHDKKSGMFFFTSDEQKDILHRKQEYEDNVIPSSNAVMAHNLFRLSLLYGLPEWNKYATRMLNNVSVYLDKYPAYFYQWLDLYANYVGPYYEVAITGPEALQKKEILDGHYLPHVLFAGSLSPSRLPLLENRYVKGKTLIYVCEEGTCQLPVEDVSKARNQIQMYFRRP